MQVKVFQIADDLEESMNQWLSELPEDSQVTDLQVGPTIVIVSYRGAEGQARAPKAKGPVVCRQCRKKLSVEGMKSCEDCLEYQKKYREKKKQEKDDQRYLP